VRPLSPILRPLWRLSRFSRLWPPRPLSLLSRLLDVVYRPGCAACDGSIAAGDGLCESCAVSLEPLAGRCPRCARPAGAGADDETCRRCRRIPPPFTTIAAPYLYGGELAVALRRLKFGGRRDVARTLAPLLRPGLAEIAAGCDLIVPMPLHWRRMARRTFNQAALLARHARPPGAPPIDQLALRRVRATAPQTGLDARARRGNVSGAFDVAGRRRSRVAGRHILLVDDIVTTGATMAAAATALLAAGARSVTGFCAARAES
jgi:ComF family protein